MATSGAISKKWHKVYGMIIS